MQTLMCLIALMFVFQLGYLFYYVTLCGSANRVCFRKPVKLKSDPQTRLKLKDHLSRAHRNGKETHDTLFNMQSKQTP